MYSIFSGGERDLEPNILKNQRTHPLIEINPVSIYQNIKESKEIDQE